MSPHQGIRCQGYHGNCMPSGKLMNGFRTFWCFQREVPVERLRPGDGMNSAPPPLCLPGGRAAVLPAGSAFASCFLATDCG